MLIHLYFFVAILTDHFGVLEVILLLLLLKLRIIFKLVEVRVLCVIGCDNCGGGIVQMQTASLARLEVLSVRVFLLDAFLLLGGVHL